MASILLWPELVGIANEARVEFRLPRFTLEPLTHTRARFFGDCDLNNYPRRIRLRVHRMDGRRPLSRTTIIGTLAHELAHLKHPGHDRAWRNLNHSILNWIMGEE
jgi:hypothetical protein